MSRSVLKSAAVPSDEIGVRTTGRTPVAGRVLVVEDSAVIQRLISVCLRPVGLTVETRDAPLDQVVRRIGKRVGFKVVMVGDHTETPLVTISFSNLSVPKAVDAVIGGANHMIFYAAAGSAEGSTISQVWLLGASGTLNVDRPDGEENVTPIGDVDHSEMQRLNDAVLRLPNQVLFRRYTIELHRQRPALWSHPFPATRIVYAPFHLDRNNIF